MKYPRRRLHAIEQETNFYYTGLECSHGHKTTRYTISGQCTGCREEKKQSAWKDKVSCALLAKIIISREDAKAAGKSKYFTGEACVHNHITQRTVSDGKCVTCKRESMQKTALRKKQGIVLTQDEKNARRTYGAQLYSQKVRRKRQMATRTEQSFSVPGVGSLKVQELRKVQEMFISGCNTGEISKEVRKSYFLVDAYLWGA